MTDINSLLSERGKDHGRYRTHSAITQGLKNEIYERLTDGKMTELGHTLTPAMLEAIDMICHKLGRIAAGNPNVRDHWDDIAGYAKLVSLEIDSTVSLGPAIIGQKPYREDRN